MKDIHNLIAAAGEVILGKEDAIRLAMTCLLARGHLLIEDLPGVGKTTLAHLLARLLGLQETRIQFTSDLLPADILGVSIYERESQCFRFVPGPIFSQLILADEINRATPKAQSALLEAMEERQVTVEGETRRLPEPFFVIATQNPSQQIGTFPLPESQLDRFLMRIELGYPDPRTERELLAGEDPRGRLGQIRTQVDPNTLANLQTEIQQITLSEPIIVYLQAILAFTREAGHFLHGLSPRAGLGIAGSARAWACLQGRDFVTPDDVQAVLPACINHRLPPRLDRDPGAAPLEDAARLVIQSVPIP